MHLRKGIGLSNCAFSAARRAALALVLAAALMPVTAGADFDEPVNLSLPGQDAGAPQVAMTAEGDALVVWHRSDGTNFRVQARARSAVGVLGPIMKLSKAGQDAFNAQVAMTAGGDALVVWHRFGGIGGHIQARARSAAGVLGPRQTLSAVRRQDGIEPQVAIDAEGNALVAWERRGGARRPIQARARSAAGVLGPIQTLSEVGHRAFHQQVAYDAEGNALVIWLRGDRLHPLVQARARSATGVLGPIQTLSKAGQRASQPQVAIDAASNALVVWTRTRSDAHSFRIQARTRSAAGMLGPIQTLSDAGGDAIRPQVAIGAGGNALVVWQRHDGMKEQIQARAISNAGVLGPVEMLSGDGHGDSSPQVAMDADGDAVVVWLHSVDGSQGLIRVQARTRSAAGVLGPIQTLSRDTRGGGPADAPQVAISADGAALAVWLRRGPGGVSRVQAAAGP